MPKRDFMEYTNNGTLNGTEVPAPSEKTNKIKNNTKGARVLTPSLERKQGGGISTPSNNDVQMGAAPTKRD